MTRLCWLRRAVRNRHRHAIEQASRRWRGGRHDYSNAQRILISTQAFAKADLEIMHTQLCAQQEWRANEPAQKLMRWTTFVRALQQLATRAFPDQDVGAAFGRLLDHVHRNAVDGGT